MDNFAKFHVDIILRVVNLKAYWADYISRLQSIKTLEFLKSVSKLPDKNFYMLYCFSLLFREKNKTWNVVIIYSPWDWDKMVSKTDLTYYVAYFSGN